MSNKQSYIPALGFTWLTGLYDFIVSFTMPENKIRQYLVSLVSPNTTENILEFGFGTGQNIKFIHSYNKQVKITGLDIDPQIKSIAQKKLSKQGIKVDLDLYQGINFPYLEGTFDKVYSCLVFHHLTHEAKTIALAEIKRVLKPGGQLIVGDWGKAQNIFMRFSFFIVQLVDGFKTTSDNVEGKLPSFIQSTGFINFSTVKSINTALGTFSFYIANKSHI
mgnify:CR=1 FL=1|jgi:ubiquinone/menaquinone biosynthesis C-methylase UbiE